MIIIANNSSNPKATRVGISLPEPHGKRTIYAVRQTPKHNWQLVESDGEPAKIREETGNAILEIIRGSGK